jgi:predicted RNA polymerase sigma factor
MELQASRTKARVAADGSAILLMDQDRKRWDRLQIQRGLIALDRARRLSVQDGLGSYALQAAIAACHARARRAEDTDWSRIAALYAVLARVAPSPVVELNRAVAVARAEGPAVALPLVDALRDAPQLRDYGLLHAVRGDLLQRLGRHDEARIAFTRAADLAGNARDRALMRGKAEACAVAHD